MKVLFKKIKIVSLLVLFVSFLGCEDDDEASLPTVTAAFTFEAIPDTGTVSFINISENAESYAWDFGNGTTSTEIEPTVTFASGTYTVSLTATNVAGASDTFEDELVIVVPEPPASLALPIDFDGTNVAYDVILGDNIGFSIVTNPETGNENTTNVGQMVAGGGQFQNVQFPLGTTVDFSGENKTIALELFSSTEIDVLVKFEEGVDGARDVEVLTTHTGSGWETLSFDFATDAIASFIEGDAQNGQALIPDGQYGEMVLFIGFNTDPGVEGTFYVDNITQTMVDGDDDDMATGPSIAAPTPPVRDASDVISLFSNAYTDITVDTFFAEFSSGGGVSDVQVAGDDVKLYTDLDFAGIETLTETVDLSNMTHFHIDVWSATNPDFIARVVDFAGDGFDGGNDTQADERVTLTAGQWNTIDVTIADLQAAGLTATPTDFSQLILDVVDVIGTVYVDNIYFYNTGTMSSGPVAPTSGPAAPTQDASNVISIYSDSYTDVPSEGFNFYGAAAFEQVDLMGNAALKYTFVEGDGGNFQVIELGGANQIDAAAAGMTNFRFDLWFPNELSGDSGFLMKLVDFGATTTEVNINVNASSNPAIAQGQWLSFDIPFTELESNGLGGSSNIQQVVIDLLNSGEVYVDNIYFYDSGTMDGGSSTCPAPPTGELLSNGGFEANAGDGACWQLNSGGGSVTIIDTDANTGTYSARLTSGPSQVPNLKQERFATDITGNQSVQVTFRYQITTPFIDGAILQVLAFSERSANGAVTHDLGNAGDTSTTGTWLTYTGTFTTDAAVDEGISLLIQATCGGAATCSGEVLIDDVVVTEL